MIAHNAGVCLLSLAMLLGTIYEVYRGWKAQYSETGDWFSVFCDADGVLLQSGVKGQSRFAFWAYVYYLSKFVEMTDTFFLALQKKPLTFLQM